MQRSSMFLAHVVFTLPSAGALQRVAHVVSQALAVSFGRAALDYVEVPDAAQRSMSPRAQRLVRCARLSAW
jgi:hypothetical protein